MKTIRVGFHSLVLVVADIGGIGCGAIAAYQILEVTNQVWLQLPIAILLSVGSFWAWMLSLRVLRLRKLQFAGAQERGMCWLFAVLWAPLVFVPLHYFTQGYWTSIGNLVALALYQLPVNALALFGSSIWQRSRSEGSVPQTAGADGGPTTPVGSSEAVGGPPSVSVGRRTSNRACLDMKPWVCVPWILSWLASHALSAELPNLNALKADLVVPQVVRAEPAAGRRVAAATAGWERTQVRHALYLPRDWQPDANLPVLVEFPGNGGFQNELGDKSDGTVDSCALGYGLSGGRGFIWVCLPFVELGADGTKRNCAQWWGEVAETRSYCLATVREVCARYGGDASRVVLCGFSRGAIACNYIGLQDDEIARLWRAFFCHSHYDGVRMWPYPDSDAAAAIKRLQRLRGREVWISHEGTVLEAHRFIERSGVQAPFTFVPIPYANHSAAWVLRNIPARRQARAWLERAIHADSFREAGE